ncbi:ribosomal protein S10 [Candidatus Scalindua japonica]|uniref:Ribosomal protein S10 n=1 Tax=Candidatus Scalindua japonica TaxID=1284222 RepID=A0A286TV75_9BACT|nr:hypothetical protein [Candidatus Scalindua japonica]GAX59820.1 ribosomal protein S10 [Candidatus Scalindua japonica]
MTLRLNINSADKVVALLDYESNGTYDKMMDGNHDLTFTTGSIYTGYFGAWKDSFSGPVCKTPTRIIIPKNSPDGDYTVNWDASSTNEVTYILEEATN